MATETKSASSLGSVQSKQWLVGIVGGLLGSVLFGLIMQYVMPPPLLEMVIPAMYGVAGPAPLAGWALHLFHGVVLGVLYIAIAQYEPLRTNARGIGGSVLLGVGYGIATTAVLAVIVMPIWLSAVGFPAAPPFPNFSIPGTIVSTVGHIVYALPVTVGYALVTE